MASEGQRDEGFDEVAAAAAERMTFFSDAVVAIAITLLAIELPVPDGETSAELWAELGDHSFEYLAFMISFLVIANHWTIHHRVFRWVRRVEQPVIQLNFLWLLLVVINPFLTRVLTEGHIDFFRFSAYAAAQTLQMCALSAVIAVVARRGWFAANTPVSLIRGGWIPSLLSAAAFLVSIPLYPVFGNWTFFVWGFGPLVVGQVLRRRSGAIDGEG